VFNQISFAFVVAFLADINIITSIDFIVNYVLFMSVNRFQKIIELLIYNEPMVRSYT